MRGLTAMYEMMEYTMQVTPHTPVDYREEMRALILTEIVRNERIMQRLDECMSAINSSRRILGEH